jgi:hypothetical protein
MKLSRIILVCAVLFALCSVTFAAEYWVIKDNSGKTVIVESRPADQAVIVKGPFPTRADAEVIITAPVPGGVVVPGPAPAGPHPVAPPPPPGR